MKTPEGHNYDGGEAENADSPEVAAARDLLATFDFKRLMTDKAYEGEVDAALQLVHPKEHAQLVASRDTLKERLLASPEIQEAIEQSIQ